MVDAPYDDTQGNTSGAVKVFDTASGALLHALTNPMPSIADKFGHAVAISGTNVVVSAVGDVTTGTAGTVYIYRLGSGTPTG